MTNEMKNSLNKVCEAIATTLAQPKHNISNESSVFKEKPHQLRKIIDYLNLFSEVGREIIDSDESKKRRGKKTRRFKVTPMFIEATECMERIIEFFKDVKVLSLSDWKPESSLI